MWLHYFVIFILLVKYTSHSVYTSDPRLLPHSRATVVSHYWHLTDSIFLLSAIKVSCHAVTTMKQMSVTEQLFGVSKLIKTFKKITQSPATYPSMLICPHTKPRFFTSYFPLTLQSSFFQAGPIGIRACTTNICATERSNAESNMRWNGFRPENPGCLAMFAIDVTCWSYLKCRLVGKRARGVSVVSNEISGSRVLGASLVLFLILDTFTHSDRKYNKYGSHVLSICYSLHNQHLLLSPILL